MHTRRFFIGILCLTVVLVFPTVVWADAAADVAAHRAQLQQQLDQLEAEIGQQSVILQEKQRERVSLERDVAILDAQIEKSKLSIKARDLTIQSLSGDISDKANTLVALDDKMSSEQESLAQILRKTNSLDRVTLAEFILADRSVSKFFEDIDSFASIQAALSESFARIADTKTSTSEAKAILETKRTEEQQLRTLQVLEQQQIVVQEKQKQAIVAATRGQESTYLAIIKAKELSAAQIRAELFTLRDSAAIPFGTALDLANLASSKTGVRAALILGVLKQETALGENLGRGNYHTDMNPSRDIPEYLAITAILGYDPEKMPVSKQPGYGWGGAMGPGQFIPSTWACYGGLVNTTTGKCGKGSDGTYFGPWVYAERRDLVRNLTGKGAPSDPWDNKDSFMATALLLKQNGAVAGSADSERLAALRYFAGAGNAGKPAFAFYGDSVINNAAFFQNQINLLNGS